MDSENHGSMHLKRPVSEGDLAAAAAEAEAADYKPREHVKEVRLGLRHRDSFAIRKHRAEDHLNGNNKVGHAHTDSILAALAASTGGTEEDILDDIEDDTAGDDDDEEEEGEQDEGGQDDDYHVSTSDITSPSRGVTGIQEQGTNGVEPSPKKRNPLSRFRSLAKGVGSLLGLRKSKKRRNADSSNNKLQLSIPEDAVVTHQPSLLLPASPTPTPRKSTPDKSMRSPIFRSLSLSLRGSKNSPNVSSPKPAPKILSPNLLNATHHEILTPTGILKSRSKLNNTPVSAMRKASDSKMQDSMNRRISFADHHGHKLEAVKFCDDLHYSDQADHSESESWSAEDNDYEGSSRSSGGCILM
jgi:hypothetical protein